MKRNCSEGADLDSLVLQKRKGLLYIYFLDMVGRGRFRLLNTFGLIIGVLIIANFTLGTVRPLDFSLF